MALTQCETCGRFVIASRHQHTEESWDSRTSSASTETPQTSDEQSEQNPQSPAPTTEPHSSTDQTESSSAPSTDGETTAPEGDPPGLVKGEPPLYDDWSKEDLQDELEERGLPRSGNKPELIERLEAHDEQETARTAADN